MINLKDRQRFEIDGEPQIEEHARKGVRYKAWCHDRGKGRRFYGNLYLFGEKQVEALRETGPGSVVELTGAVSRTGVYKDDKSGRSIPVVEIFADKAKVVADD